MHFSTSALVAINCAILLLVPVAVRAAPPVLVPGLDELIPTCDDHCLKIMQRSSQVCTTVTGTDASWCLQVRAKEYDRCQSKCTFDPRPVSDLNSCNERCNDEDRQVLEGCSVVPAQVLGTCKGVASYRQKRCRRVCDIDYKAV